MWTECGNTALCRDCLFFISACGFPSLPQGIDIELVHRTLMHILSMHRVQLTLSGQAEVRKALEDVADISRNVLAREKVGRSCWLLFVQVLFAVVVQDTIGFNLAALSFLQRKIDANANSFFRSELVNETLLLPYYFHRVEERLREIAAAKKDRAKQRKSRKRERKQDKVPLTEKEREKEGRKIN